MNRWILIALPGLVVLGLVAVPFSAHGASGRALYDEGAKLFAAGDFEKAAKKFAAAYKAEPEPAYLFSEASAYRRIGNAEVAAARYEKYLSVLPAGEKEDMRKKARAYASEMRLALGLELQVKGECRSGVVHLAKAIVHDRTNGAAYVALGECHETLGDLEAAGSAYASALGALAPDDALARKAKARLEALGKGDDVGSDDGGSAVTPVSPTSPTDPPKKKKKKGKTLGIALGVTGGVVVAGVVATVVVLVVAGGSTVSFPGNDLGVMDWESNR